MRLLGCAAAFAVGLAIAAAALATSPAGPQFGVYTGRVGVGGGGLLIIDVSVTNPTTKASLVLDCGKPTTAVDSVTEIWDSPIIPLRKGSFSVHRTVTITRQTTVTKTNALVSKTTFTGTVDAQGAFTSHGQFAGTVLVAGSPCNGTHFTASRLAGPTLTGPSP
jgi:hypothetical protein